LKPRTYKTFCKVRLGVSLIWPICMIGCIVPSGRITKIHLEGLVDCFSDVCSKVTWLLASVSTIQELQQPFNTEQRILE